MIRLRSEEKGEDKERWRKRLIKIGVKRDGAL